MKNYTKNIACPRALKSCGLILASLALWLASCALASESLAVQVLLPPFPEGWGAAESWELSVEQGGHCSAPLEARPGETLILSLPRRSSASVYCVARLGGGRSLPFGAAWPQHSLPAEGGRPGLTLPVSAAGGFAAAFGAMLERGGFDASGFNLERFGREAEARLEDPWTLDVAALARVVANGSFRADSLRECPEKTHARFYLPLELAGAQLRARSPWAQARMVAADGGLDVDLCYTPSVYFVGGYKLSAGLSPGGEPCWTLSSLSGAGGL